MNITAPTSRKTWRRWPRIRRPANGGRSASRCSRRSRPARKANGGPRWKMSSTPIEEDRVGTPAVSDLRQAWPRPSRPRPIVIIGAGGIVNDAHLPAYRLADFPVAGIFDIDRSRADSLAAQWGLKVFSSLAQAAAVKDAVFDLAIPPAAHFEVLGALPEGSAAVIQKPRG